MKKPRAAGHALRSSWRDRLPTSDEMTQPHVIRFKGPVDEPLVVHDAVQGEVRFNTKDMGRIWSCCDPTARRPITWPWSSTTTTWASPISFVAMIT